MRFEYILKMLDRFDGVLLPDFMNNLKFHMQYRH